MDEIKFLGFVVFCWKKNADIITNQVICVRFVDRYDLNSAIACGAVWCLHLLHYVLTGVLKEA